MAALTHRLAAVWRTFAGFTYPRDFPLVIGAFRHRRYEPCPADIWRAIDPLGGYLRSREAGLLYWAALSWPVAGPVIELGSFEGRSTIVFARAGRFVHAVDAWSLNVQDRSAFSERDHNGDEIFARFKCNISQTRVADRVSIHRGLTHTVARSWRTPTAVLFVDAGHTYADAKCDLDLWTPFLLPGGLLLMHDVIYERFPGVTRAAGELLRQGWRVVASADSLVAFARRKTNP